MRTFSLQVRTPEGIVFTQMLAGPVPRFLAWLVDLMCIGAILSLLGYVVSLLQLVNANLAAAFYTLAYFIVSIGYGVSCEWAWRGQTVGKKLLRLRVVDVEGLKLQFSQIVTRNLLRFVDGLPATYLVGGIVCWIHPKCQRLGDIGANTVVIRIPIISEPNLDQLSGGKFNSLREHPHLAARLRQRVSPVEAAVALQALLRREEFEPAARVELFTALAGHFREKVKFPAEATVGVADEQYVRNVTDVVYRSER